MARNLYGGQDFDWEGYGQYRPEYPSKLYDMIFDYHARGAAEPADPTRWQVAADFGSGPGTIVPALLSRFDKVIGSDMNEPQIQFGRKRLVKEFGPERLEMHVGKAEECDWVEDGTADLVTAAEAVHWFDAERWIAQAARVLKPGGTLAFWIYPGWCSIVDERNAEASKRFTEMMRYGLELFARKPGVENKGKSAFLCGLTNIEIDKMAFDCEERHNWHLPPDRPAGRQGLGQADDWKEWEPYRAIPYRVGVDATVINHSQTPNAGQCGSKGCGHIMEKGPWTMEDYQKYLKSIDVGEPLAFDDKFRELWNAVEESVVGESGTFYVAFPLYLVLARRRS